MAIIESFDGTNKHIYLGTDQVASGELRFNAADFLSEIIDWRNIGTPPNQNDKWVRPIRAAGGDDKGDGQRIGTTVFLMNDWVMAFPDQTLHVVIEGELLLDQSTNTNNARFYFDNLSPSSRVTVEFETPGRIEIVEVSANGVTGSTFTTGDRTTLNQVANNVAILLSRLTEQRAEKIDQAVALLRADEVPGQDRYVKRDETDGTILVDKDVIRDAQGQVVELRRHQ